MSNKIQGNPTKSFFIEMITRDISIKDAILDLLDNSIDGANKINSSNYEGKWIKMTINKAEFVVEDNCGGFSLETAQKYAFRFGRPDEAPTTTGSVGRFGIGMKRALFKIGESFEVESKTEDDHFQIDVNVDDWKKKKRKKTLDGGEEITEEDWDFTYENINDENRNLNENGTYIKVENLHPEVSELFDNDEFLNDLGNEIERLLNFSLEKKLKISLNEKNLTKKDLLIFNDQSLPYLFEGEKDNVKFRIIAGIGEVGRPASSGWYIYCNDRLVLEADRSEITGWGTTGLPRWHIDYVMFRGIVFMDSEEPINLPLTTTKKGVDATSDIYKSVLVYMKDAMGGIIPFLKQITKLGDEANEYRKILGEQEDKLSVVNMKNLVTQNENRKFLAPAIDTNKIAIKKEHVRIAYDVKKDLANTARYHSGAKSFKELGEYSFYYYLKMEEIENE